MCVWPCPINRISLFMIVSINLTFYTAELLTWSESDLFNIDTDIWRAWKIVLPQSSNVRVSIIIIIIHNVFYVVNQFVYRETFPNKHQRSWTDVCTSVWLCSSDPQTSHSFHFIISILSLISKRWARDLIDLLLSSTIFYYWWRLKAHNYYTSIWPKFIFIFIIIIMSNKFLCNCFSPNSPKLMVNVSIIIKYKFFPINQSINVKILVVSSKDCTTLSIDSNFVWYNLGVDDCTLVLLELYQNHLNQLRWRN